MGRPSEYRSSCDFASFKEKPDLPRGEARQGENDQLASFAFSCVSSSSIACGGRTEHAQLDPLIRRIFENIADQDAIDILESCYVHYASLRIVTDDLNVVIRDSIPQFLKDQGTEPAMLGKTDAGRSGEAVSQAVVGDKGELFLLLGGIGSGKTTFMRRYQRTVGMDLLDSKTIWFHIDFLGAPLHPMELELFVWRSILDELRSRYRHLSLERRRNIKRVFADDIAALVETGLRDRSSEPNALDAALSPYLEKWQQNLSEYVPRILKLCTNTRHLGVALFIDNVDQLAPAYRRRYFFLRSESRAPSAARQLSLSVRNPTTLQAFKERSQHILLASSTSRHRGFAD